MDSIKEWLNGSRNYHQGAALYNAYGDDILLKQMFAQGESEYRKERLLKALRALLATARQVAIPVAPEAPPTTVHLHPGESPESRVPQEKDPYYDQWILPYREMQRLRGKLIDAPTDEKRGELAHKILKLELQCKGWWDKRDYLLEHGVEMKGTDNTALEDVVTDPAQYHLRLSTVRTYITKANKKLKQDPDNSKALADVKRYTAEKERLERLIG